MKSKKGEGSTFTINFGKAIKPPKVLQPAKTEISEAQAIVAAASTSAKGDKPIVLLVEDDSINQDTIKRFISKSYNALTTDSADEVIEILKKQ